MQRRVKNNGENCKKNPDFHHWATEKITDRIKKNTNFHHWADEKNIIEKKIQIFEIGLRWDGDRMYLLCPSKLYIRPKL